MILTVILAFVAGFQAGNGIPYYVMGSTGDSINPSPFPKTPRTNVVVGWGALLTAAVAWYFADVPEHPILGYSAAALGVLTVGLIHAGNWRKDPWRRRAAS